MSNVELGLFHETLADAIREVARLAGGTKPLAAAIWPAKSPNDAHRQLLDCLNDDRPHKLAPGELMMIARIGRERECDAVMTFICRECGYEDPRVANMDAVKTDLQTRIADGLDYVRANMGRLDRMAQLAGK